MGDAAEPRFSRGRRPILAGADAILAAFAPLPCSRMRGHRLARFPKVREGLGRKILQEIGAEMVELRKTATRKPRQPSAQKAIDAVIR